MSQRLSFTTARNKNVYCYRFTVLHHEIMMMSSITPQLRNIPRVNLLSILDTWFAVIRNLGQIAETFARSYTHESKEQRQMMQMPHLINPVYRLITIYSDWQIGVIDRLYRYHLTRVINAFLVRLHRTCNLPKICYRFFCVYQNISRKTMRVFDMFIAWHRLLNFRKLLRRLGCNRSIRVMK